MESVQVIPDNPCTFCSGGAHFQAITIDNFGPVGIYQYFPADFAGLGGNVLLTSEGGVGTVLVTFDGTNYVKNFFDNIPGGIFEGSTFVDCNVPTPTPTPTATATFTPTPTPTPTSTPGGGVGTIGYWANHPNAWCVSSITLGCQTYTESEAIAIIKHPTGGDMTYALGAQLAAAKLNVNCAHADSSCVASAITAADSWLCSHPIGSNVSANSPAWQQIAATYNTLVNYNEGRLCAPRRR